MPPKQRQEPGGPPLGDATPQQVSLTDLMEIIAAGPTSQQQQQDTRRPLGVPSGYTLPSQPREVRVEGRGWIGTQGPVNPVLYFEGDDLLPSTFPAEDIAALQRSLVQAGLLDDDFRLGVWDPVSVRAYRTLLEYANASGTTWNDALVRWQAATPFEDPGAGRAPLTTRVTNPADLRALLRELSPAIMGARLRPEEEERFIAAYQAQERGTQQSAYDIAPTGGTVTDVANPQVAAEAFIRQEQPVEAGSKDVEQAIDSVMGFLLNGIA